MSDVCPICAEPLNDDDICATDIEMGPCHAACLDGSPTVDLETGEEIAGPMDTYRWGDTAPSEAGQFVANSAATGEAIRQRGESE